MKIQKTDGGLYLLNAVSDESDEDTRSESTPFSVDVSATTLPHTGTEKKNKLFEMYTDFFIDDDPRFVLRFGDQHVHKDWDGDEYDAFFKKWSKTASDNIRSGKVTHDYLLNSFYWNKGKLVSALNPPSFHDRAPIDTSGSKQDVKKIIPWLADKLDIHGNADDESEESNFWFALGGKSPNYEGNLKIGDEWHSGDLVANVLNHMLVESIEPRNFLDTVLSHYESSVADGKERLGKYLGEGYDPNFVETVGKRNEVATSKELRYRLLSLRTDSPYRKRITQNIYKSIC